MTVRTPLYEAGHAARYERQGLIRQYQTEYSCRLVVMQDDLFPHSIQLFEETLFDADPQEDLHIMLATQGGALACVAERTEEDVAALTEALKDPLIGEPKSHGAVISAADARSFGLPICEADPASERWQAVWRLWMKYAVLNAARVYEGQIASYVFPRQTSSGSA